MLVLFNAVSSSDIPPGRRQKVDVSLVAVAAEGIAQKPLVPRRILLVRHGATVWSRDGRHTGRTNLPLLPEGETEAKALEVKLADLLAGRPPDLVLSSPLRRALDTCRLAGYGDEAVVEPDLVEWDYGEYEGRTTAQIREERPGWDLFRDGCPGGESLEDVAGRAKRVLGRLREDPSLTEGSVLVFSHGHALRVLAVVWPDFPPEQARAFPLETGAVGVLGWARSDPAIERWNA